ncbi:MAG: SDR family NAD(P)-dependent oxidoreductase [Rhodospirillales bacterium]|jgi:3-oxoacyl-[acyl-carrier protein] reductase|nr:SDR family NAD(P)-dependent oxidoreductase [Rhodospirillales bacterium]MDP6883336.1 SDR family NAD(P)-dependent oxidoreductase [Rhodospirillales bacterium]
MDLGLAGKTALVSAASRGLGRACALSLAREGVDVTIVARRPGPLEETAGDIRAETGVRVTAVAADITDAEGRAKALAACPEPDILVTNTGGPPHVSDFRRLGRDDWIALFDAYLVAPISLIQATVDGMIERRFGRIVNITSIVVKMPGGSLELSAGPRAGFTGFVAGLARQVVRHNVTINNLLPGSLDTDRVRENMEVRARQAGCTIDEMYTRRAAEAPAGRIADPQEFGDTCAFLSGVQAGYITGQNLLLDGGRFPGTF